MPLTRDDIIRQIDLGLTIEQIAASSNVSVRRVYQIRGTEKAKPRITDEQIADIRARHYRGQSIRDIAAELSMSRKTIAGIVGEQRPANAPISPEEEAEILRRAAAGHSAATIAKEMERWPNAVAQVIDRDRLRDCLQDQVIARAAEFGWDANRLDVETAGRIGAEHIRGFLARERSMGSHKIQHLLRALRGRIVWDALSGGDHARQS